MKLDRRLFAEEWLRKDSSMKALMFQGLGKKALEERPKPTIAEPTDAIVKITKTTICGTDLHILKGDARSRARSRRRRFH
jgi:alcohol dehydrogenase